MDIIINFLAEILDFIIDFFLTFIEGRLFSKKNQPYAKNLNACRFADSG